MAITSFIDPFGSMVQGYREGQQTELQRQAAQREMRDSDYDYGLRQVRDPMMTRMLDTQMNQGLLDYLTARDHNPIQTSLLRERQAEAERMNAEAMMTQGSRIANANLQPDVTRAGIDATRSGITRNEVANRLTGEQIAQLQREGKLWDFSASPLMQSPEVGIPALTQRYINQGVADPNVALQMAQAHWSSARGVTPSGMVQPQAAAPVAPPTAEAGSQMFSTMLNDLAGQMPGADPDKIVETAYGRLRQQFGPNVKFQVGMNPDGTFFANMPEEAAQAPGGSFIGNPMVAPYGSAPPDLLGPAAQQQTPVPAPAPAPAPIGPPQPMPAFSDAGFPMTPVNRGITSIDEASVNRARGLAAQTGASIAANREREARLAELAVIENNVRMLERSNSPLAAQARSNLEARKLIEMGGVRSPAPAPAPAVATSPVQVAAAAPPSISNATAQTPNKVSAKNAMAVSF